MARTIVAEVEGIDDPRVAVYRSLRRVARLRADRRFVAEGARVVTKLLASDLPVVSLLVSPRWLRHFGPALERRPEESIEVYVTPKAELERIVGFHVHQGVMAVAAAPEPPDLTAHCTARPQHLLMALEGVSNAENVGGILRTLAGFGADGLLIDGSTCDPFVRRAARVSMGAAFSIPVFRTADLPGTIGDLRREHGTRAVAAHLADGAEDLDRTDLSRPLLVALGSEATGLSDGVVEACDAVVTIPMDPTWDCLNVGTAGAVLLWEIVRRERSGTGADQAR